MPLQGQCTQTPLRGLLGEGTGWGVQNATGSLGQSYIGCLQVQHTELVEDKLIDADTALVGMDERGEQTCRHGFKLM